MAEPAPLPWTLRQFFAWQDRQADRYELVGGFPLRMMVGVRNVHDTVVVNVIIALGNQLRGKPCRPFTGESAIETLPGQIRRPDVGVDCGPFEPDSYKATEPKLVIEVLSPSTRDFDTFEKLAEYKAVESLEHIIYVDPDAPNVAHWIRDEHRAWVRQDHLGLDASVNLATLKLALALRDVYNGVVFPPPLRRG